MQHKHPGHQLPFVREGRFSLGHTGLVPNCLGHSERVPTKEGLETGEFSCVNSNRFEETPKRDIDVPRGTPPILAAPAKPTP